MGPVPVSLRRAVLVGIYCPWRPSCVSRESIITRHVVEAHRQPGVRIGYSGFFNYLAFLPVGLGDRWAGEAGAYVAGRGLVAGFGVLSVFLLHRLARDLAGDGAGLLAAGLLAVSRGEVGQSHYITPDVVVVTGTLADDGSGVLEVAARARPPLERVAPTRTAASHDMDRSSGPWLGTSFWRSPEGGAWISGEWPAARRIERVEVVADEAGGLRPQWLELEGRSDADTAWRKLEVWPLRPGRLTRQSADSPPGQIYVMAPPVPLVGLRLSSQGGSAWGLSRIEVLAEVGR